MECFVYQATTSHRGVADDQLLSRVVLHSAIDVRVGSTLDQYTLGFNPPCIDVLRHKKKKT